MEAGLVRDYYFRPLIENYGLKGRNFDGPSAARIFAAHLVVEANAIIARLGVAGAVTFVGAARQRSFFNAPPPADGILG